MERIYKISGSVSGEAVEEEIARAWTDVQYDERLRRQVAGDGVDVDAVASVEPSDAITVRPAGAVSFEGKDLEDHAARFSVVGARRR